MSDICKTLHDNFCGSSEENYNREDKALKRILKLVNSVPAGQEALNNLNKLGYSIEFESIKGNTVGLCYPVDKAIVLNTNFTRNTQFMASTLVHEATHAKQADAFLATFYKYKASDMIKYRRAKEADAVLHQVEFEHQLAQSQPETFKIKPIDEHAYDIYTTTLAEKGRDEAARATFKCWYDFTQRMDYYDQSNVEGYAARSLLGNEKISNEKIMSCCLFHGKPSVEPEFLDTPLAFSMLIKHKKRATQSILKFAKELNQEPDLSIMTMHTRTPQGRVRTNEPINRSPTRLVAAFKQNQR